MTAQQNITDLIRQRNELNRQITVAQEEAACDFTATLYSLYDATLQFARECNLAISESRRKNVDTITLGNVSIAFAFEDGAHRTGLFITTIHDGIEVNFNGRLPDAAKLIGILLALLNGGEGGATPGYPEAAGTGHDEKVKERSQ